MIEVNGKKLSQEDVNILFVQACRAGNLANMLYAVEVLGANVDATDARGYAPAIVYAARRTGSDNQEKREIEATVRYLVNKGANIDFKHGDKGRIGDSKTYFLYIVASNPSLSDDLVYSLIKQLDKTFEKKDDLSNYLDYVPTTKSLEPVSSIRTVLQKQRPELYKKLVSEKLISNINNKK